MESISRRIGSFFLSFVGSSTGLAWQAENITRAAPLNFINILFEELQYMVKTTVQKGPGRTEGAKHTLKKRGGGHAPQRTPLWSLRSLQSHPTTLLWLQQQAHPDATHSLIRSVARPSHRHTEAAGAPLPSLPTPPPHASPRLFAKPSPATPARAGSPAARHRGFRPC